VVDGVRRVGRASMREVAELAGVAMSSVSRVLSDHPDVSPAMRQRVHSAVDQLGYKPDLLAQSLRRRETRSVGFVVADISNQLFGEIVKGAETTLRDAGYSMLLTNSENNPELDAAHVRLFEQRRTDGLILSLAREEHPPTIAELEQLDVPIVLIDRDLPPSVPASRVLSDHRSGMSAAVEHLLDLGHRRIAFIAGQSVRPSRERRRAFEAVFAGRGLPRTYDLREGMFSTETGAQLTRELLDSPHPPTALIAGGNQLMIGALGVVSERGIELGRELSFVGCDDIPVTGLYKPPIAVVRRDNVALGRTAAELLLRLLRDGDAANEDVTLPTEFVPAPSCGPVRA
jgi:LacI family transcriptional regulator, galactose operon repressor